MAFGRRTSPEVAEQLAADEKLAATYQDRLAEVDAADGALRRAQADGATAAEQRTLAGDLELKMRTAIGVAEAAERVAMGSKTYGVSRASEIARRKARAKAAVRPYSEELDRLRTAREAHKLSYRALSRA
ncbi:plectin [Actinocorallia longicatena]|uniref:Plectin n=1 Tax=Actinocorallia longicatena TaxID=111803 RepID=A0ABP6PV78_9ACTN